MQLFDVSIIFFRSIAFHLPKVKILKVRYRVKAKINVRYCIKVKILKVRCTTDNSHFELKNRIMYNLEF